MGKRRGKHPEKVLAPVAVNNTKTPGRYADGNGLYLVVDKSGAKRWMLRVVVQGKRRDMGLGGTSTVSLARARELAAKYRAIAREGGDPLLERQKERTVVPTFRDAATQVHRARESTWRNEKHRQEWLSSLERYAFDTVGERPVNAIQTGEILRVLSPIWLKVPDTARKVRQRIHVVMDWVRASGFRPDNPVDGVEKGLPKQPKRKNHFPALPYSQVPEFIQKLHESSAGLSAKLAMEFVVLTAARSGEALKATWSEVDLEEGVWTVPAERMKAHKEHRVPLAPQALEVLKKARELSEGKPDEYIFPGQKPGRPLSDMTLVAILRRMKIEAVTHGFRSSFRDWAEEQTHFSNNVCEAALAHTVENAVERAYRRTDLFEKRKELMARWAQYVTGTKGKVVQLRASEVQ